MDILSQKAELRKEAKLYRKSLSQNDRLYKSTSILNNLKELKEFQKADVILMYASLDGEVETLKFIQELLDEGKKEVYCPVTLGDEMEFYRILSVNDLHEGYFHVLEPVATEKRALKLMPGIHYCMVMPGLMFDKEGNRLGYGRGYYDKYLSRISTETRMITVALSYDAMVRDELPTEETDYKADYVITEKMVYL